MEIAKAYRPPLYRLLMVMEYSKGIISYYEGLKVASTPLDNTKTKMNTLNELVDILLQLEFIQVIEEEEVRYLVDIDRVEYFPQLVEKHRVNMALDCAFLPDIRRWMIKHNIVDNDVFNYRNRSMPSKGVHHNNYVWDAFAYTKTTGINTVLGSNKAIDDKSTLVVLDVLIHREYTELDLQGFYERIQAVRNSTYSGVRKILPVVFAQNITPASEASLRNLGFMIFHLGTIFGEKIYDIVRKLELVNLEEAMSTFDADIIIENIEGVLAAIKNAGQEENLQNVKGDLFEALMYPLITTVYNSGSLKRGQVLKEGDEFYEYDAVVYDRRFDEVVVIELKGYKSNSIIHLGDRNKKYTVRWFFRRTFPFAQKKLQRGSEMPVKACYITTATFSEEAKVVLEKINDSNLKPHKMDVYYDGPKLLKILEEHKLNDVIKVLKRYYMESSNDGAKTKS